jgi:transaldolase
MSQDLLGQLRGAGVSVRLNGVTRARLRLGELAGLVRDLGVSGVITNPSLFAASLADAHEPQTGLPARATRRIRAGKACRHVKAGEAARVLAAADLREACDNLLPTHQRTSGVQGWVSLEVDPDFAKDANATLAEVRALSELVDRPNLMIKIPATSVGVTAIAAITAAGRSINATLILSVKHYREVLGAYTAGLDRTRAEWLERDPAEGLDISGIHSVASLFVAESTPS